MFEYIKEFWPFLIFVPVLFIFWARNGGGGKLGRAIRNSDRHSLEFTITEKQRELDELKALRNEYPFEKIN